MLFVGDAAGSLRAFAEPSLVALLDDTKPRDQYETEPQCVPDTRCQGPFEMVATFDVKTSGLDPPSGMDLGPDGNLYVVDASASRVVVLAPEGKVVRRWGTKGTGEGQFDFVRNPSDNDSIGGVAVDTDGLVSSPIRSTAVSRSPPPRASSSGSGAVSVVAMASSSSRSTWSCRT